MDLPEQTPRLTFEDAKSFLSPAFLLEYNTLESFAKRPRAPLDVMREEWDVLLVLDACRYDFYRDLNFIPGRLEARNSLGCCTVEWIERTFKRRLWDRLPGMHRRFDDVVYVSANPFVSEFMLKEIVGVPNPFFKIVDVWRDGWDEESGTVFPDTVTDRVFEVMERYPDKRIIAHYMQPHAPYIWEGETCDEGCGWRMLREDVLNKENPEIPVLHGDEDVEAVRKAYSGCLRLALKSISRFTETDKRVRVTADHGEYLGEFTSFAGRVIGHPQNVHTRTLDEVPWFLMETRNTLYND
jgi:hypothetical protein